MTRAFVALSIVAFVLATTMALARPGNGQSYRSGGSGGSSTRSTTSSSGGGYRSSSSGSSSWSGSSSGARSSSSSGSSTSWGSSSPSLPRTGDVPTTPSSYSRGSGGGGGGNALPVVVVTLVVGVSLLMLWIVVEKRQRERAWERTLAAPAAVMPSRHEPRAIPWDEGRGEALVSIEALRKTDPALSRAAIFERVRAMATIVREAWCAGDMRPARAFTSDGVYGRFQTQLALMQKERVRNAMADAEVLDVSVVAVEAAAPIDVVHVRVTARARDVTVPIDASPDAVEMALAHAPLDRYTEIWSLVRKHGATTPKNTTKAGVECPKCGAPLAPGEPTVRCRYCKALVCSGEHDWVLAEITQQEEWSPASASRPAELAALRASDPLLAREVLEDRASYLFWKWIEAGRTNDVRPLRKSATRALLESGARLEVARDCANVAVGAVDVALCDPAADGDPFDHVDVLVRWSAQFGRGASPLPMKTALRLARKRGAKSKLSFAVVCHACGAPLTDSDSTTCDHCAAELADGEHEWVLDAVLPPGQIRPKWAAAR